MKVVRVLLKAPSKADALVDARVTYNALVRHEVPVVRHEHVTNDKSIYIDVPEGDGVSDTVKEVVGELTLKGSSEVRVADVVPVDECVDCGNVSDEPFTVCPNCGLREIEPCPNCEEEVPRTEYVTFSGNTAHCPRCGVIVGLTFNDPLWDDEGRYVRPLVIVKRIGTGT